MLKKHPIALIEHAVRGMLPKTRLGRAIFKNMHVYTGSTHPHEAQNPKKFELK
jgi:large subunit ribosomal protein L13